MVLLRRRIRFWAALLVGLQSLALIMAAGFGVGDDDERTRRPADEKELRLELLGGFRLSRSGDTVAVAPGARHLLAFLALHSRPVDRILVAGTFWPDVTERRAYGALRAALGRLDPGSRGALKVGPVDLRLADGIAVDVRQARALAQRLLDPDTASLAPSLTADAIATFSLDLLPGWYDDWAMVEAEDWRQLRLHALDVMAVRLTGAGRFAEAAAAASAAVRTDPLRETAQTALIRVHLAEGNRSEALREFDRFRRLLKTELGLDPSPQLSALVSTV